MVDKVVLHFIGRYEKAKYALPSWAW